FRQPLEEAVTQALQHVLMFGIRSEVHRFAGIGSYIIKFLKAVAKPYIFPLRGAHTFCIIAGYIISRRLPQRLPRLPCRRPRGVILCVAGILQTHPWVTYFRMNLVTVMRPGAG